MRNKVLIVSALLLSPLSLYAAPPGLPDSVTSDLEPQMKPKEAKSQSAESDIKDLRLKLQTYLQEQVRDIKNEALKKAEKDQEDGKDPSKDTPVTIEKAPQVVSLPDKVHTETVNVGYKMPKGAVQDKIGKDGYVNIDATSSKTHVVNIAHGLFNKIITPFQNPKILSPTKLETKIVGNTIFIGTNKSKTIGLWVYQDGAIENAVSLVLVPKPTAPVEIRINMPREKAIGNDSLVQLPSEQTIKTTNVPEAAKWESSSELEDLVVSLIQDLEVKKEVPKGYGLVKVNRSETGFVCGHPSIKGKVKYIVKGKSLSVEILSIKNFGEYPERLDEKKCYTDSAIAASVYPPRYLKPNGVGDLYIVKLNKSEPKHDDEITYLPKDSSGDW